MKYTGFYLWPPRPSTTIQPFTVHVQTWPPPPGTVLTYSKYFEAMKQRSTWRAQLKLNGQRNVIYIAPDGAIQMWNRHHDHHLNWKCPKWLEDEVRRVVKMQGKWIVIDGELLHAKDKTVKNTFYWWDVLVLHGEYMLGSTYRERFDRLQELVIPPVEDDGTIAKVSDMVWLARNITPDRYDELFKQKIYTSYVEGFVFKDMAGRLQPCLSGKNNSIWQVRCRKAHTGGAYRF